MDYLHVVLCYLPPIEEHPKTHFILLEILFYHNPLDFIVDSTAFHACVIYNNIFFCPTIFSCLFFQNYSIKFNAIWWDFVAWIEFSDSVHFHNCDQSTGRFQWTSLIELAINLKENISLFNTIIVFLTFVRWFWEEKTHRWITLKCISCSEKGAKNEVCWCSIIMFTLSIE